VGVLARQLVHPSQASRVLLRLYDQGGRFLVTEERRGTVTVVATLGSFDTREAALARLQARESQLLAQRYAVAAVA
jgi:hypothetical protein